MGRHASSPERRVESHKQAGIHVLVLIVLLAAAGYGVFAVVGVSPTGDRETPSPNGSHTRTATRPQTLVIKAVGKDCAVVVSGPSGVLLDETIRAGASVQFDQPSLNVEVADAGAVQVYVNGVLRAPGRTGAKEVFTASRPG